MIKSLEEAIDAIPSLEGMNIKEKLNVVKDTLIKYRDRIEQDAQAIGCIDNRRVF